VFVERLLKLLVVKVLLVDRLLELVVKVLVLLKLLVVEVVVDAELVEEVNEVVDKEVVEVNDLLVKVD
jgi:hypothetical protein